MFFFINSFFFLFFIYFLTQKRKDRSNKEKGLVLGVCFCFVLEMWGSSKGAHVGESDTKACFSTLLFSFLVLPFNTIKLRQRGFLHLGLAFFFLFTYGYARGGYIYLDYSFVVSLRKYNILTEIHFTFKNILYILHTIEEPNSSL